MMKLLQFLIIIFFINRLYRERVSSIDSKLDAIRLGTATEYLVPLERLKEQKETRVKIFKIISDKMH